MFTRIVLSLSLIAAMAASAAAQVPAGPQQVLEPIVVNGQQAQGVLILQNGIVQGQSCSSPQPYVTPNHSESGWACFDQATGMWLLHAQPPAQASAVQPQPAPSQPAVIYTAPTPVYVPDYYPYAYYPYPYYGYPYGVGPYWGFGFGFGFRGPVFGGFRGARIGGGFGRGGRR